MMEGRQSSYSAVESFPYLVDYFDICTTTAYTGIVAFSLFAFQMSPLKVRAWGDSLRLSKDTLNKSQRHFQ